jgi:hypothetical protein
MLNTLVSSDPTDDLPRLIQGHGREGNRRILVLFCMMKEGKGKDWTRDELRLRARHMLKFRSEEMFRGGLAAVHDSSDCGLAEKEVAPDQAGLYTLKTTCKKSEQICRQPDAIDEELDRWTSGAEKLRESSPHESMGETGLKMASSRPERKGRNCYEQTGDLSIAVDCPPNATVLTTDQSFEVMRPGIERDVLKLPPTKPPPKGKSS